MNYKIGLSDVTVFDDKDYSVSLFMQDNNILVGSIELSKFFTKNSNTFYFSRLFVKPKYRNKGIANKLLSKLVEYLDTNKNNCVLEINPYGDLNYEQLKKLYEKYGFKSYNGKKCLVRKYLMKG